jgi:hypothetical protein
MSKMAAAANAAVTAATTALTGPAEVKVGLGPATTATKAGTINSTMSAASGTKSPQPPAVRRRVKGRYSISIERPGWNVRETSRIPVFVHPSRRERTGTGMHGNASLRLPPHVGRGASKTLRKMGDKFADLLVSVRQLESENGRLRARVVQSLHSAAADRDMKDPESEEGKMNLRYLYEKKLEAERARTFESGVENKALRSKIKDLEREMTRLRRESTSFAGIDGGYTSTSASAAVSRRGSFQRGRQSENMESHSERTKLPPLASSGTRQQTNGQSVIMQQKPQQRRPVQQQSGTSFLPSLNNKSLVQN